MDLKAKLTDMAKSAKKASLALANLDADIKNAILAAFANGIAQQREQIKQANAKDCAAAKNNQLSAALIDRLTLTDARIDSMINGIKQIAKQTDPIGTLLHEYQHPNGMIIQKRQVPIGVIVMIYESRPNVTADVAALCLKSGNAVILRGGREALQTNIAIMHALENGYAAGLPANAIQLVTDTDREGVKYLVQMNGLIDLAIPRGGEKLIQTVTHAATIPVIKHDKGLCHIYLDKDADCAMAVAIVENAKCQRPGVCNAAETLLVHANIAEQCLPAIITRLQQAGVECRGCARTQAIVPNVVPATEADWATEYLDKIISIKIVDDIDQAIAHIGQYGSQHSEAIISSNRAAQQRFCQQVDAAAVYVNASTRFTDGGEFGLGAEIGISTDKCHARGPMGVNELTSYKYIILGTGQTRTH